MSFIYAMKGLVNFRALMGHTKLKIFEFLTYIKLNNNELNYWN